jgi:hypothetical protein
MEEDICQNQTPFKFLVYLENSIFRSISKKVYETSPNLPYKLGIRNTVSEEVGSYSDRTLSLFCLRLYCAYVY